MSSQGVSWQRAMFETSTPTSVLQLAEVAHDSELRQDISRHLIGLLVPTIFGPRLFDWYVTGRII